MILADDEPRPEDHRMSTIDRPETAALPPLTAGQRLDRATFHARYEAMPSGTWAELIDGIVSMPSPLGVEHNNPHCNVGLWLGYYRVATPGVRDANNATTFLGDRDEVQPDGSLAIPIERGGRMGRDGRYFAGPPDLVVEVAVASLATDLGVKRDLYGRSGVHEYVVVAPTKGRIIWHAGRGDDLVEIPADPDGLHRSETFPGLWLNPAALLADDGRAMLDALNRGLATPEHAAFVEQLARARPG